MISAVSIEAFAKKSVMSVSMCKLMASVILLLIGCSRGYRGYRGLGVGVGV